MSHIRLRQPHIAIIGAGIAGLACAARLRAGGIAPIVFEKSRGVGGRVSTRRVGGSGLSFDHGAQYVTARLPTFRTYLEQAAAVGASASWRPHMSGVFESDETWWVGAPTMNALTKPLARDLDVRPNTEVVSVLRELDGYRLKTNAEETEGPFDVVICTAPAPQAVMLLGAFSELTAALGAVRVDPCWALMVACEGAPRTEFDAAANVNDDVAWIARNHSKPQRSSWVDGWVIHASTAWSREHLELGREEVARKLIDRARSAGVCVEGDIVHLAAHRWRYARTVTPLAREFLASADGTLLVGGDWCLGARVECAFQSGQAMAEAVVREAFA